MPVAGTAGIDETVACSGLFSPEATLLQHPTQRGHPDARRIRLGHVLAPCREGQRMAVGPQVRSRSRAGGASVAVLPPPRGFASGVPVARFRRPKVRTIAGLTPHESATSRWEESWCS